MKSSILTHPIHLGLGATAIAQPPFVGMEWYEAYAERAVADGAEGQLVSAYDFAEPWPMWEMHPHGDEVVLCLSSVVTLHQERDGGVEKITLHAGEFAINSAGVWHTADVAEPTRVLFITAGMDTQHRPR